MADGPADDELTPDMRMTLFETMMTLVIEQTLADPPRGTALIAALEAKVASMTERDGDTPVVRRMRGLQAWMRQEFLRKGSATTGQSIRHIGTVLEPKKPH